MFPVISPTPKKNNKSFYPKPFISILKCKKSNFMEKNPPEYTTGRNNINAYSLPVFTDVRLFLHCLLEDRSLRWRVTTVSIQL